MGFPWQTKKARRQQEHDEDFARRALMDLQLTMAGVLRPAPTPAPSSGGSDHPLSPPLSRKTDETWKQVIDLFCQHGLAEPPVRLRDELVNAFEWAWIGHALTLESKP